jgi:hypothetical protein
MMVEVLILRGGPNDEFVGVMDRDVAMKDYIFADADKYNCGMCRYWEVGGHKYYDVGPITYKITEIKE